MKKITYTEQDIRDVYDEVDRRISMDIAEGEFEWDYEIIEYRNAMLQGVYGTLMIQSANWPDVTWWIDEIEKERYADEIESAKKRMAARSANERTRCL